MKVIHWSVNITQYHPMNLPYKEDAFIFVGSKKERKGVSRLLQAFKVIIERNPEIKLYMVGIKNKYYNTLISKFRLGNNIIQTGLISHNYLLKTFSICKCHVLPSMNTNNSFEGFGLVHLEANACGLPAIGSIGTANEEIIIDGYNGLLCDSGDVISIYECMRYILENPENVKEMSFNAIQYAKESSWDKTVNNVELFINYIFNK